MDKMKTIKIEQIIIPDCFKNTKPKKYKLDNVKQYVKKHGKLNKPIVLNDNYLVDGYTRYLVAKELGLKEVEYVYEYENNEEAKLIKYIVGKFKDNGKEYIWKVPLNVRCNIKVGDKVWVEVFENKKTVTNVVKVDVIENNEYLKHKNVLGKYKSKKVK